ncbi:MAG TPA: KH domain-containing protein [Candidatus Cloacimonadota bacterium]|nr:KH domain-containing protein [Candidatus Cloacimonadota bacterium]HOV17356.1 KH domain-containing protein [Candidatus Cloacimonadota bacterium]HQL15041.1 KH domain-containing protein [Candidatus Cloacimonadota bacterium]
MKELIEFIVKALVDDPSQVDITEIAGDKVTLYELRVSKNDIGKVIGKRGRTASAIRTIINAVSTKQGKRAELEIIE